MKNIYDSQRRELARQYHRRKDIYNLISKIFMISFLLVFFAKSIELKIFNLINIFTQIYEIKIILFVTVIYLLFALINNIINYFLFYRLNRKYELSNQNSREWLIDQVKSLILSLIFIYLASRTFLLLINNWPNFWWLIFTIIASIFTVLITFILPEVLLPIFYKLEPYPDTSLKKQLLNFISGLDVEVEEIYQINLSSKMNMANAAVIGLGNTQKIILGDTLDEKYSNDEIEAILAHEIAHYVNGDIFKNLLIQPVTMLITTILIYQIWPFLISWQGYESITSIYVLPLFWLTWGLLYWLLSPIQNYISRKYERAADSFSLKKIDDPSSLGTGLAKIADESLSKLNYNFYELLFKASHPSIGERVENALECERQEK